MQDEFDSVFATHDEVRPVNEPGPWFVAGYDDECSRCFGFIFEGDTIRADGDGGWEHKECVDGREDASGPFAGWVVADCGGICVFEGLHRFDRGATVRRNADGDFECKRCVDNA